MGLKDTIFFLYAFSAFGILACFFPLNTNPGIIPAILSYLGILIFSFYVVALALTIVFKKKDGSIRGGAGLTIAVLANVLTTALFFLIWGKLASSILQTLSMIIGVVMIFLLGLVIKEHMMGEAEKKIT